jgi:hypothetical protein
MPVLKKLQDGRILFFWLNSSPLPPLPRSEVTRILMGNTRHFGIATDMFTNRDVHHAAISEDDGKTWIGFRELFLDPRRNAGDYAKTGGVDRGMHQSQCVELGNGKILVAFGQHPLHRSMAIFDLGWLYEKSRSDDFSRGSGGWSLQTYLVGVMGHRALNRRQGAQLIEHPAQAGKRVLHVCRTADPELISENQGAVWNFPAGRTGTFTTRIMLREGGQGARISLLDHWINPTDATVLDHAMYSLLVPGDGTAAGLAPFTPGVWHELRFEWADSRGSCKVAVDGRLQGAGLPLIRPAPNGICYVHFYSAATRQDGNGFLIESVAAAELHVCERG